MEQAGTAHANRVKASCATSPETGESSKNEIEQASVHTTTEKSCMHLRPVCACASGMKEPESRWKGRGGHTQRCPAISAFIWSQGSAHPPTPISPATLKPKPTWQIFCWCKLASVHRQKQVSPLGDVKQCHPTKVSRPVTQPQLQRKSTEQQQSPGAEILAPSLLLYSRLGRQRFLQKTSEAHWQQRGGEGEAGSQGKELCRAY